MPRGRRLAHAALILWAVVAAMVVTLWLGDRRDADDVDQPPGPAPDVVPVAGGVTHAVASRAAWDNAVAAAQPGDVIRLTNTITERLAYRGTNDGAPGTGGSGTAAAPIVITADPGVWIDPGNQNSGVGALDVIAVDHVHVVAVNVRNAQFGVRCLQCRGAAGAPIRIVDNNVTDIGHAGITFAGHWATHAASSHGLIAGNVISDTGRTNAHFGEGVYIGHGSTEWVDETSNVEVRGNNISRTAAEGVDIKPGTRSIIVRDNLIHDLAPASGGAISAHYVNAAPNPKPAELDHVLVQNNLIWNVNLNGVSGSNDWAIWVGHGGVDLIGNRIWGLRHRPGGTRAIRVRATQAFGPHPIRIEGNTFWTTHGWVAEGSPSGAANVVAAGNVGVELASAEVVVGADAFAAPVPALGTGGAADGGSGPGSALTISAGAVSYGIDHSLTPSTTTTVLIAAAPSSTDPPGASDPSEDLAAPPDPATSTPSSSTPTTSASSTSAPSTSTPTIAPSTVAPSTSALSTVAPSTTITTATTVVTNRPGTAAGEPAADARSTAEPEALAFAAPAPVAPDRRLDVHLLVLAATLASAPSVVVVTRCVRSAHR
ncbi:MAG: right-handed parallel beta-helix repeat-containing protein [Actinomycetota bacterium]